MTEEFKMDYSEMQKTVEALLPGELPFTFEELVNRVIAGDMGGLQEFLREVLSWLFSTVSFPAEHGVKLFLLVLFSALFSNLSKAFSREGTAHVGYLCVYFLMAVHMVSGFMVSLDITTTGMENLSSFTGILLPMYCISIAVVTGSVTAAGYYQGTAFLLAFFELLARYCLIPLSQAYLLLAFASCMQKRPIFRRMLELIVSLFGWIRKTMIGIAITLGAVQGILTPAIDRLKRTTMMKTATVIPGVGDLIGGAWETVMGAGVVLKNSIGMVGSIFLILIMAIPIVKLALQYLMYRVLAAVSEPVAQDMTEQFLHHMGIAQKLLLETLTLGVVIFILLLAVMTRITV